MHFFRIPLPIHSWAEHVALAAPSGNLPDRPPRAIYDLNATETTDF